MRLQFKHRWAHRVRSALRRGSRHATATPLPIVVGPPTAEWDEAFQRVESYLRAHRLESRMQLNQLTTEIINAARALAVEHPHEPPVTLAMQITHARIGEWLGHALEDGDWADERFRARGRLALLLAGVPHECPERFLARQPLPAELQARLRGAQLEAGPEVRLTSMSATALEFPLADLLEEKWVTFSRSVFSRTAALWLLIGGVLGAGWFVTR